MEFRQEGLKPTLYTLSPKPNVPKLKTPHGNTGKPPGAADGNSPTRSPGRRQRYLPRLTNFFLDPLFSSAFVGRSEAINFWVCRSNSNYTTTTCTCSCNCTCTRTSITIPFQSQPVAQLGVRYMAVLCTGASRALEPYGQVPLRIAANLRPTQLVKRLCMIALAGLSAALGAGQEPDCKKLDQCGIAR